ncbi:cation:proton antiporter domain-containing protein [Enhygromyxa salina]|uniref:Na(+)/H(+) antiporter NhaP n=1 Tax=Enhygromyxa salina TaxID=215803 RepID=A0A2S9YFP4_9BACT|nr:cation:proton antiporter [Enhygromyxa salina]PRQ03925.1 Na(+)/H(+) antiporter NhaP [Enhygromyxa salina]
MRQLLVLVVLVLLMQVVIHHGVATSAAFDSLTLLTTGFILVGAYTMGELARRMRLPALLGYLAAGVLFGPKLVGLVLGDPSLAPLGSQAIRELGLVNVLAVGVIGTMGGGEIKLPELRENLGKLAAICGAVFVLVLPLVAGVVLALTFVIPSVVPFLAELPLAGRIAGALLFGALAVGMSPAATLAILQEVHARGRFTSLVLGVVVIGDLILVATFLLVLALAKLLISPEGLTLASLADQLPHIAAEFGWALALGVVVGVAFISYLRFVHREVLLFSLALVFVTAFVASRLHAETLLAFLVAGFIVQNFSRHGHTLVEAFERIALPVFVVYFTAQAANLDLIAVTVYLPLTLILVGLRSGLFVLGVGFGARVAGVDETTRRRLQVSFFSQGGVDLVLAAMVAEAIPGWGAQVQTVTMATILFYVVGGPLFLARALDAAGESAAARERGAEQLASSVPPEAAALELADAVTELVLPRASDPALLRRLEQLHEVVSSVRTGLIEGEILARSRRRSAVVEELAATISSALELELEPESSDAALGSDAQEACARLDAAVAEAGIEIEYPEVAPFNGRSLLALFAGLDRAQDFSQNFRVSRGAALFEARGGRWARTIRVVRRVRRSVVGPGHRTVPLGRLWRHDVALAVPVALWRSTRPIEAQLWHALLEHYRLTRAGLEALARGTWAAPEHDSHDGHDSHAGESAAASGAHKQAPVSVTQWLTGKQAEAATREATIGEQLNRSDRELEHGLLTGLGHSWSTFLASVEIAGTLELPAWRTRPSRRYDAAQAASAELLERSARDREAGAGRFDALLALAHAEHVATSIHLAALEFEHSFTSILAALGQDFDDTLARIATTEPEPGPDQHELDRALVRMGEHVEGLRTQLTALAVAQPPALLLALANAPDQLAPSTELALADPLNPDPRRTSIRLRGWLAQTLLHDFGVARASADDELGVGLDGLRQTLIHIARVADYHLGTPASVIDAGLSERLTALLEGARAQVEALAKLVREHVEDTIATAERTGLEPIRSARWDELRRRQRRLEDGPRAAMFDWLRERRVAFIDRARTLGHTLGDEFSALSSDRHTASAVAAWRRLLFGSRSTMPDPYQRLFTSVPAETIGLLINRPELQTLKTAAEAWLGGRSGAILVYGDRGVGKRTLVRQLLQSVGPHVSVHWLRLSPALEREAELVRGLAPLLGVGDADPAADLSSLQQQVLALTSTRLSHGPEHDARAQPRPMLVIENAERLFRRTGAGLERVRRFLDLVAATSDQVLWVVLIAEPAVPVLDAALELRARFEPAVRVPAMDAAQLAAVLDGRHRLSGYPLRIDAGMPSLTEWVRGPQTAWRLRRGLEQAAYERLAQLSGGNVRQALRLWLAAARVDPRDGSVVVGPLPGYPCPLLADLPVSSRVLLAALMLHGPLRRTDLVGLQGPELLDLDTELTRLARRGLVMLDEGGAPDSRVIQVETRLVQPLTSELRACNLL